MKMGRVVIVEVHSDDDAVESRYLRHARYPT
jgi:hypothetical protein